MSTGNLPRLRECLIELHLPAFREHYAAQAALATQESLSYPRFLLSLSEIEVAERHERKIQRQRRASKLPWEKTLTALDRSRLPRSADRQLTALLEGTFLDRAENVLAFGNPGSGKTHLVCALGQELILLGRRVLFSTCALLVQRLLRAKIDLTLEKELKKLDRFEALIVDDIGSTFSKAGRKWRFSSHCWPIVTNVPQQVLLTSNLIFSDWEQDLQGPPDDGSSHRPAGAPQRDSGTQRPELSNGERQGKAAGNHEMRKPRGGQIRANRLRLDPGKCLVRAIDECPPRGEVVQRPTEAAQQPRGSGPLPSTPNASEGELRSAIYALTPSPSHSRNNLSFLQKGGPRKGPSPEDGYSSFFLILVWGFPIVAASTLLTSAL